MKHMEVTLEEVLRFREKKALLQLRMLRETQGAVVVSLGMNIPGPVKCGPPVLEAFLEGQKSLEMVLKRLDKRILQKKVLEKKAGYAVVYLVENISSLKLKQETILLEETHELGRIWDIDVLGTDGAAVTRRMLGADSRKCLLCGQDAKVCGRSRKHSVQELQDQVSRIITGWKGDTLL